MPQQTVPSIEFDFFALGDIEQLFKRKKIYINKNYQRGDIWKKSQKIELIKSIKSEIFNWSIGIIY